MRKLKSLLGIIGVVTILSLSGCGGGGGGSTSLGSSNDLDNLGPILISSFPFDNAPSILPSTNIIMKFNKTIVKGDGYIKIYNQNDSNEMIEVNIDSEEVILNNDEIIIHLLNGRELDSNTTYYINVDSGAIKDSSGVSFAGIDDSTTLNFKTVNIVSIFEERDVLFAKDKDDYEKWGNGFGTGVNLTYSFAISSDVNQTSYNGEEDIRNGKTAITPLNDEQKNLFRNATQKWANIANITFTEVADVGPNTGGDIRVAFYHDDNDVGGSANHAKSYYPFNGTYAGDIWLNDYYKNDYFKVSDLNPLGGLATMIHELGHSLAISHPNDDAEDPDYSKLTTIMSYNTADHSFIFLDTNDDWYRIYDSTPMVEDIKAIQKLYGANMTYNAGDTIYGFHQSNPFFMTIWDAGGNDTISTANFSKNCVIDLNEGQYSSIRMDLLNVDEDWEDDEDYYDGTKNLGLAYGVTIENAIGGSGDDRIIGNAVNNYLTGRLGKDTFVFNGEFGNDTITDFIKGSDILELKLDSTKSNLVSFLGDTITIAGYGTITLSGIDVTTLTSGVDYKFVP